MKNTELIEILFCFSESNIYSLNTKVNEENPEMYIHTEYIDENFGMNSTQNLFSDIYFENEIEL